MARAASLLLITGLLAACSTADVLTVDATPPETVGSAPAQYNPPAVAAAPAENVARQSLAPPSGAPQQTYSTSPQTSYPATASSAPRYDATPGVGRPPSTFGAQLANLAPAEPAYTPPPQQTVAAPAPQTTATAAAQPAPAAQPPAASAPAATAAAPSASIAAADTLRFLPIIGAPSDKLQPLSARLGESARAAGLSIVAMDDDKADLSLKGYFSAVDQEGVVSVIYVWDVIGANGVRLHRIQDRQASETGGFTGSDPWAGVSADMMAAIGQKSIGSLLAWLDTQG
ncbi:hypothetical protein [Martelella mediterranea]|uniref:Lipoprotein n=1 Tax=Martelella mediterranea DSM 17316 TaxID=1122214 RepID=A0A1U9Z6X6_9HYPH|nr:hypothetical protein [Martelella mediterranea]AQZ53332.1 hypothetical protein Mame_04032 [Martelella mediterranea DSM 17316]